MSSRTIGIFGVVVALVVAGGIASWFNSAPAVEERPPQAAAPIAPPPGETEPDVAGLPPLFPEGQDLPESDVTFAQYYEEFDDEEILDPRTSQLREEKAAQIREEIGGKRVTWEGYVARVRDAPSGRVMIMLTLNERPSAEAALFTFSAAWSDHVRGYQKGDHVRVVGVYDRMMGSFPSMRGMSIEPITAGG